MDISDLLHALRTLDYTIRWWDHPAGWTVTNNDDETVASNLTDEELVRVLAGKLLEMEES